MARAMTRARISHIALLAAALALSGCVQGSKTSGTEPVAGVTTPGAKAQKSTRLVDRDVEAPEVFQVTDDALWDGRPSLGGVWVASPDTKDPERVIMRNPANGKFVIGALFRRERENPGPALQISSDAAAALGILAGAPAKLSITALRREEAPEEAPTSPILDTAEAVGDPVTPDAIVAGGVETVALDAGATVPPAPEKPGKKVKKPKETAAIAAAALDAAVPAPDAPAPAAAPPAPAPAAGGRPIQIGIFSVEANAKRAVDTLAKAGVDAEIRTETSKGKTFWSVIARGDAAALKKVKAAGFADAYLLK
jgi:SPOR domain